MLERPLLLALSLSLVACIEEPQRAAVAGLAVLTIEGQQLVLDTGNGGKHSVSSRGGVASAGWHSSCRVAGGEIHVMLMNDSLRDRGGFAIITVDTITPSAREGRNVFADTDTRFSGACGLSYQTAQVDDRYDVEVSVEGCTLTRVTGEPIEARIDAFLSARRCVFAEY